MGQENARHSMVTRSRFIIDEHYAMLQGWWKGHGSFAPKIEHLPETGILVNIDGKPVTAGFLYKTDSKICIFEFMVSDPEATREKRDKALEFLIESVKEWSSKSGYTMIYTSTGIGRFVKRLKDNGFVVVDRDQTHCFYEV